MNDKRQYWLIVWLAENILAISYIVKKIMII